ncbi:FtsH protease activity modulator HflK [Alterisphingorhabdus coralli]|uniref:Protein HflK n=1 Tax=Alterisphingorhabdus coralli TaxID=3071408 RepID=A0AA97FA12_9SPHN|nr:FtsH protease activity modulator HflK [Parasphingorhabdus sp. SCSIO 66989]WOE75807.1 FtsH protease activity modulator HflK [Parasphingorhabdus sp. SCSIO 66989]
MTIFSSAFSRIGSLMAAGNPWGGGSSDGGKPSGGGSNGGGPSNPWQPSGSGGSDGRKSGSIEDLFRKGGSGGPGGGFSGLPKRPNGKSYIPWILVLVVLIWIGMTSIWRVDAREQGVVKFLGSYSRTVGPGINFTLPSPIETMEKVDTQAIREMPIGTPSADDENFVLTSDQNIIDMAYEVRWQIRDPEQYLFQLDSPEDAIRDAAESAMRAVIANFSLDDAIGPGRSDIEAQVRTRMQTILDDYGAGITVQGIAIRQSDPPQAVNEAFKEVNVAQQDAETAKNNARAYARQIIETAEGQTSRFDQVYEQYRLAPEVTRQRLYYETMERVLGKVDKTIVETGNVTPYLPLPELRRRAETAPEIVADEPQVVTGASR